jgi:hypothetical protein
VSLRKTLAFLLLLGLQGFSAAAYAVTCAGEFTSQSAALSACTSAGGGACVYQPNDLYVSAFCLTATTNKAYMVGSGATRIYYAIHNGTCPATKVDIGGKCVPACTVPGKTHLAASDPLCVANPCAAKDGTLESAALVVEQCSPGATSTEGITGCEKLPVDLSASYNLDGCSASVDSVQSCAYLPSSGETYCTFSFQFDGTQSSSSNTTTTAPSGTLPTGVIADPTAPQCPTGSTYDPAKSLCVYPATSGTPSTSEGAGTPAIPESSACPVGESLNVDGYCVGPAPPGGYACRDGSMPVNGTCVISNASVGPGKGTAEGSGTKIDETGVSATVGPFDPLPHSPGMFGIGEFVVSLPSFFPDTPRLTGSDECVNPSAFTYHFNGIAVPFDVCAYWAPFKPWLAWFLYALTFIYCARVVRRSLGVE